MSRHGFSPFTQLISDHNGISLHSSYNSKLFKNKLKRILLAIGKGKRHQTSHIADSVAIDVAPTCLRNLSVSDKVKHT